ncbi:MAG: xanthine phosphoribosyltransferase [Tissierellia bacterium]|nr:xanthine phosphoribosyltransferase [Tissierellia bacterium]
MKLLKKKIREEGIVEPGGILRVDQFLNHRLDIEFINEVGIAFKDIFRDRPVDKILTIESSGIAIATITAQYLHVPVVFAKKNIHVNLPNEVYIEQVESFTQKKNNQLVVAKKMLCHGENILILDDFLAKGNALQALLNMVQKAGANVTGIGIVIEKAFQGGGDRIRDLGYDLVSLATITAMDDQSVTFSDED